MRKQLLAGCAALLTLNGCGTMTKEQVGAAVGGVLGAAGGNLVPKGGRGARTAGTVLGGAAGAIIGASIGRRLDERDRARANAATMAVLRQPLPPGFYRAAYATPQPRSGYGFMPPAPTASPRPRFNGGFSWPSAAGARDTATGAAAAIPPATSQPLPQAAASSSPRLPNVPRAPSAQWVSDHSGASGSAAVVGAEPPTAERGECRTVRQTVQIGGRAETADQRFCQEKGGGDEDWKAL